MQLKLRNEVFFFTIYSLGLRLGEVIKVKVGDIDADHMRVHIRDAKGNKDRFVPLPENKLHTFRVFWMVHKDPLFIFPNRKRGLKNAHLVDSPLEKGGIQTAMKTFTLQIGFKKISCPSLRHSYVHLLEVGGNLIELQKILSHVSLLTTVKYAHLTAAIQKIPTIQ